MLTPLIPKAQASPNFPDLSCFEELHTLLGLAQHDSTAATHICHWPNESKISKWHKSKTAPRAIRDKAWEVYWLRTSVNLSSKKLSWVLFTHIQTPKTIAAKAAIFFSRHDLALKSHSPCETVLLSCLALGPIIFDWPMSLASKPAGQRALAWGCHGLSDDVRCTMGWIVLNTFEYIIDYNW